MQRLIAPYIKQYIRNNNSSLSTEKLQLGTGVLAASFVPKLLNQMKKNADGGYKQTGVMQVSEPLCCCQCGQHF